MKTQVSQEEFQAMMAHAVTVGLTANAHTLDGSVSSEDVGCLVYNRSKGITAGFFKAAEEDANNEPES